MAQTSQNWEQLDNRYYRKLQLYEMEWVDIDLTRFITAMGPNAGPVAIVRDPKLVLSAAGAISRPAISIFTAAGRPISNIPWDKGTIVGLGWSDAEQLVITLEDGSVHVFTPKGDFVRTFSMGQTPQQYGVREVKMCAGGAGMVILTNNDRFFSVARFEDPRPRPLATIPEEGGGQVTGWTVLKNDKVIEVVAAANSNVYVLDPEGVWEPVLAEHQRVVYTAMSVSSNGRMLAMFSESGTVWVITTDFQENRMSYDVETQVAPRDFVWCGSDSVVAYWDQLGTGLDTLLMIGPGGKWLNYCYDSRVVLLPEVDGLRIVSAQHHEFLQAVPESVERVFLIGSMSPGAMLYDARADFERHDPLADERIRDMKESQDHPDSALKQAIRECIQAAGHEWDSSEQRSLLRAARFGKDFVDTPTTEFVAMCQTLRVLWHLRHYKVGYPLTHRQLTNLSLEVVIDRLIARGVYWLAYEVCKYLKLEDSKATNRVLVHWASSLIQNHVADDDVIAQTIIDKLGNSKGISFAEIAQAALGRPDLAIRLLDKEPRSSEQVPLLLSMNEDAMALKKAIESGDTDLVHFVILHLKEKTSGRGNFFRILNTKPVARDLFLQYCRHCDPESLQAFYFTHDCFPESADLALEGAYAKGSIEDQIEGLKQSRDLYAKSPEHLYWAKSTDEQVRLLERQRRLEAGIRQPLVGLPLSDTMFQVLVAGDIDSANKLKKEFAVPPRRFWTIKVKALAQARNWPELERFAKSKKSPIGYGPFVDECIAMSNTTEAQKYIAKLPPDQKVPYLIRTLDFTGAVEAAVACRSDEQLDMIAAACQGRRDILRLIDDRRGAR
eukprot:m.482711 g.482711  ORF g.482711 m.482711 type:complete len:836 (-) comp22644_c0_seq1:37-2544(-)